MSSAANLCIVCAYRATCRKQFSLSAGRQCSEFARDFTIKEDDEKT